LGSRTVITLIPYACISQPAEHLTLLGIRELPIKNMEHKLPEQD